MEINSKKDGAVLLVFPSGRMDAHGSKAVQKHLADNLTPDVLCAVMDLSEVSYISSAGVRVFLINYKALSGRGGVLAVANPSAYVRQVLDMSGLASSFPAFTSMESALKFCRKAVREHQSITNWNDLETRELPVGRFKFVPGSQDHGQVVVLGDVSQVLKSEITENDLVSKPFSQTEYSIGLGGLGDKTEDYFPIMGEMITIGGTMVWLPTDGHDTPDFLIPKTDTGLVNVRTAFNVSIQGDFNEFCMFESTEPGGTRLDHLYRALFLLGAKRQKPSRGVLGLAAWAQLGSVYGSGVTKSPIRPNKPAGGGLIIDPENIGAWMDMDTTPRLTQATCLMCGVGADLTSDLGSYDRRALESVFYIPPAHIGKKKEILHNHGVIFSPQPMPLAMADLDHEIKRVVDQGDFLDMRHLLDKTTITRAFIGISYTRTMKRDLSAATSPGSLDEVRRALAAQKYKSGAAFMDDNAIRQKAQKQFSDFMAARGK